jgi:hypothetical protein
MNGMRLVCALNADLSALAGALEIVNGPRGTRFYRVDFEVCVYFGGTQLRATLQWKENVSTRNSPPVLVNKIAGASTGRSGRGDSLQSVYVRISHTRAPWQKANVYAVTEYLTGYFFRGADEEGGRRFPVDEDGTIVTEMDRLIERRFYIPFALSTCVNSQMRKLPCS